MKIYINGLGHRDTRTDTKEIIWFFTQRAKSLSDNQRVSYFLQLKKSWSVPLIQSEAYEILQFISEQVTTEQERKREKQEAKARANAEIEMLEIRKRSEALKQKNHFLKLFKYYNTPN